MFAIQVLEKGRDRAHRRWKTVATAHRKSVAERVLASVRMDREAVNTLTRLRPFNGDVCRAYHLSGEG